MEFLGQAFLVVVGLLGGYINSLQCGTTIESLRVNLGHTRWQSDGLKADSTFESLGIDSLDIVEMIMDLESELGIELEMEDQKITTFGELADFIESKLQ